MKQAFLHIFSRYNCDLFMLLYVPNMSLSYNILKQIDWIFFLQDMN